MNNLYPKIEYKLEQWFGLTKYLVFKRNLPVKKNAKVESDFSFVFADHKLFDTQQSLSALDISKQFIDKAFALDHQCLVALKGNKIVGYSWITQSKVQVKGDIWLQVPDGCLYLFKSYVLPNYRGNKILDLLCQDLLQRQSGAISAAFCFVSPSNYPSQSAFRKSGFNKFGHILFYRHADKFRYFLFGMAKQLRLKFMISAD